MASIYRSANFSLNLIILAANGGSLVASYSMSVAPLERQVAHYSCARVWPLKRSNN